MNKRRNILGIFGMLLFALAIGYCLFTLKEIGVLIE